MFLLLDRKMTTKVNPETCSYSYGMWNKSACFSRETATWVAEMDNRVASNMALLRRRVTSHPVSHPICLCHTLNLFVGRVARVGNRRAIVAYTAHITIYDN